MRRTHSAWSRSARTLGAYPTGYGLYQLNTEGVPSQLYDTQIASGFTHFQQSGTGAIRKYYNYFRVTPMLEPLDSLGNTWPLHDEQAEPGYYAATLSSGIGCELTVGPKSAVHRYTFPSHKDARLVIDFSMAAWPFRTVRRSPSRTHRSCRTWRRPGRDRRRGCTAGGPSGMRRRRPEAAAVVRPAADARRYPA